MSTPSSNGQHPPPAASTDDEQEGAAFKRIIEALTTAPPGVALRRGESWTHASSCATKHHHTLLDEAWSGEGSYSPDQWCEWASRGQVPLGCLASDPDRLRELLMSREVSASTINTALGLAERQGISINASTVIPIIHSTLFPEGRIKLEAPYGVIPDQTVLTPVSCTTFPGTDLSEGAGDTAPTAPTQGRTSLNKFKKVLRAAKGMRDIRPAKPWRRKPVGTGDGPVPVGVDTNASSSSVPTFTTAQSQQASGADARGGTGVGASSSDELRMKVDLQQHDQPLPQPASDEATATTSNISAAPAMPAPRHSEPRPVLSQSSRSVETLPSIAEIIERPTITKPAVIVVDTGTTAIPPVTMPAIADCDTVDTETSAPIELTPEEPPDSARPIATPSTGDTTSADTNSALPANTSSASAAVNPSPAPTAAPTQRPPAADRSLLDKLKSRLPSRLPRLARTSLSREQGPEPILLVDREADQDDAEEALETVARGAPSSDDDADRTDVTDQIPDLMRTEEDRWFPELEPTDDSIDRSSRWSMSISRRTKLALAGTTLAAGASYLWYYHPDEVSTALSQAARVPARIAKWLTTSSAGPVRRRGTIIRPGGRGGPTRVRLVPKSRPK